MGANLSDSFPVTTNLDTTDGSQSAIPQRAGRRPLVVAAAAIAVIVLGVGATLGIHRWTTPSVFRDGDTGVLSVGPLPLSEFPLYVGFGFPDGETTETVTLDSADIHFSQNTGDFTATVLVCTQRPVKVGTLGIGTMSANDGSLSKYCTSVRPLEGGTQLRREQFSGQHLVAVLTPSQAGAAHIDAINIRYSRGARHLFQHGTQRVAQDITLAAKN